MTREQAKEILAIFKVAYPSYNPEDKSLAVDLWSMAFPDKDFEKIKAGVLAYIKNEPIGFAPSPGQLKPYIEPNLAEKAWNILRDLISRASAYADEDFEEMPRIVQKVVGSPEQLRKWGRMDSRDLDLTVRKQFIEKFEKVQKEELVNQMYVDVVKGATGIGAKNQTAIEDKRGKE